MCGNGKSCDGGEEWIYRTPCPRNIELMTDKRVEMCEHEIDFC